MRFLRVTLVASALLFLHSDALSRQSSKVYLSITTGVCSTRVGDTCIMELTLSGSDNYSSHVLLGVSLSLVDDNEGQYALLTTGASVSPMNDAKIYVRFVPRYPGDQVMGKIEATGGGVTIQNLLVGIVEPALPGAHLQMEFMPSAFTLRYPDMIGGEDRGTLTIRNAEFSTALLSVKTTAALKPFSVEAIDTLLAPGDELSLWVILDSTKPGEYVDTLRVLTNAIKEDGEMRILVRGIVEYPTRATFGPRFLKFFYPAGLSLPDTSYVQVSLSSKGHPIWLRVHSIQAPFYFIYDSLGAGDHLVYATERMVLPIQFRPILPGQYMSIFKIYTYETGHPNLSAPSDSVQISLTGDATLMNVEQLHHAESAHLVLRGDQIVELPEMTTNEENYVKILDLGGRDVTMLTHLVGNNLHVSSLSRGFYFCIWNNRTYRLCIH